MDLFFVSNTLHIEYETNLVRYIKTLDFQSDHNAVQLTIHTSTTTIQASPKTFKDYCNTNWRTFNHAVNIGIDAINVPHNRCMTAGEVDEAITQFQLLINNTISDQVPNITIRCDTNIILPDSTLKVIRFKNKLRRQWQRNRYTPNANFLKSRISCLQVMIQNLINQAYVKKYEKQVR